jgi:DNA-binding GntR family transcriptional regulator
MQEESVLEKIEKPKSLDEQAHARIKQAIISGAFKPESFLSESQLARDLGISKTPIRKALAQLAQENFLVNVPFEGYYVAEISAQDIHDIYELRAVLESHLIRSTASNLTDAEIGEMESYISDAKKAYKGGNYGEYYALNRKFHRTFAYKHGNMRILNILVNLDEHVQRILAFLQQQGLRYLSGPDTDHLKIVQAIRKGNFEQAADLMYEHLTSFSQGVSEKRKELKTS